MEAYIELGRFGYEFVFARILADRYSSLIRIHPNQFQPYEYIVSKPKL